MPVDSFSFCQTFQLMVDGVHGHHGVFVVQVAEKIEPELVITQNQNLLGYRAQSMQMVIGVSKELKIKCGCGCF